VPSTREHRILGANGSIARVATQQFLEQTDARATDARLTLYLRSARRVKHHDAFMPKPF